MDEKILQIGKKVPDFIIDTYDAEKKYFSKFTLQENIDKKKWTALIFYPADFTFVCPTELKDVGEKYESLKELGCEVLSISTDTQYVHLAWHEHEQLLKDIKFKMGADPTGKISKLFGIYDETTGLALRGTFIINPEGILVSSEVNFYNVGRNADELLRKMICNEHLSKHPGEACPAKWEPGQKTLIPSEKIVGKVQEALS
ncbi:MAG: peroxiredoxin [Spirochaetes bacterium]|nr:peroxiredoxin [Spirochaetota bacterium]